jgi:hypothetical protein
MPAVKNVGEPCAGEPHARFEVAAGGNQTSRAHMRRTVQAPLADPTATAGRHETRFCVCAIGASRNWKKRRVGHATNKACRGEGNSCVGDDA